MAQTKRNFPKHTLSQALVIAQKIADENAGAPMNRLLVADALGIKPASSNFKYLLSSSRAYGLTEGTEKAAEISLTELGKKVTKADSGGRMTLLRQAVLYPPVLKQFFERFNGNKVPSPDILKKLLATDFGVAADRVDEAVELIRENGEFASVIRSISGSPHVMLEGGAAALGKSDGLEGPPAPVDGVNAQDDDEECEDGTQPPPNHAASGGEPSKSKPIFIGHGKNKGPLEKLEKILTGFQIPFKVAIDEANLGRPIPTKVRELMLECGSAILIFTKDEKFVDSAGNEIWRPSENVGHELGACSFAYEDRIVIFKEQGINLPTNYSSIGYIEFEENLIEAKTAELLQELIGFGLVKITPTG